MIIPILSIQVQWKDKRDRGVWRDTGDTGADPEKIDELVAEYQKNPNVKAVRVIDQFENQIWPKDS